MVNTLVKGTQSGTQKPRPSWGIFIAAMLFAGLVAGFISLFLLADSLAALGIPDPGRITTFGLPLFRGLAWLLMALSVGSFLASSFLIAPRGDNDSLIEAPLSVDGHIAARTGTWSAFGVAAVGLVEIPMIMSDLTGTPFFKVFNLTILKMAFTEISSTIVWGIAVLIALTVGIIGSLSRTWAMQPVLLLLSILQVVPIGLEGHSATGGDHDYGTNSLLWHLVFVMLWVGGLMALIAHGRRLGPNLPFAVKRYSAIAFMAIVVLAVSGLINTLIRMDISDLPQSPYGIILITKFVLTILLGILGLIHRELTIPQLDKNPRLFIRIAIVELAVMAGTIGVAITLGRTVPPPPRDPNLSSMQILMGYNLHEAPTVFNIWTMFRFDIMFGTIGLLMAAAYGYCVYRVHKRGLSWDKGRTAWFMVGSLGLTLVMSTGLGLYMPAMYSIHMLVHMILSMTIPLLMVLGAPVTLVMEAYEPGPKGQPSPHDYALALTQSKFVRVITNPFVNLAQYLFFLYVLYLFPSLYEFAISEHAGHLIMNYVFLISGYFYFWEVIGPDPLPKRHSTPFRLGMLFLSMPFHLFAGVYLMQLQTVLGLDFYQYLELPWDQDLLQDQRVGGGIAWGFGQFPLVIVFGKLFLDWLRDDRATARRHDVQAEADDDAELARYNAMLEDMSHGDESVFRGH